MGRRLLLLGFVFVALGSSSGRADQLPPECGSIANAYGPFDYRTDLDKLPIVDKHHFNSDVEQLRKGLTSTIGPGPDLNYALRAFPNHHRALMSMVRLSVKEKSVKPIGAGYTVECFLRRAETFRPDDMMVKVIYGIHLLNQHRNAEAIAKLEEARDAGTENANIYYNLGLAYIDVGHYDKALASAHKAYQMGFPLPGLRDKLKRAGKWKDPVVASVPEEVKVEEPQKIERAVN
jgi:tetratricopeptide (TPR) repeat protein